MTEDEKKEQQVKIVSYLERIKAANTLKKKIKVLLECGDFNAGKVNSMSKRRKKIALRRYTRFYSSKTEKFIHPKFHRREDAIRTPVYHTYVEHTGKPFNDMMEAWVNLLTTD